MAAQNETRPIILKRKIVVVGDGHQGGAWKVAYADFVTAMMAFFLLMWLLNATTEEQRKGLSDYFNPTIPISRTSSGGAGMLAGTNTFSPSTLAGSAPEGEHPKPTHREPGKMVDDDVASPPGAEPGEHPAHPGAGTAGQDSGADSGSEIGPAAVTTGPTPETGPAAGPVDATDPDAAAARAAEQAERERLAKIERDIADAIRQTEDGALERHFLLHITPEGLVIEIIDADDRPLFASASARPAPVLELLADMLVPVLSETLNDIAVVGHTDAVPFGGAGYSNWELSADRANTARRLLRARGLPENRIVRVTGKAAVEPLVADPNAPQNRRIALILLREPRR
jgi:chemotaxis protein MotB